MQPSSLERRRCSPLRAGSRATGAAAQRVEPPRHPPTPTPHQAGQCAVPSELSRLATYASADPLARIVARSSPGKLQAAVTCGPYCDLGVGGTTPQGAAAGATCAIAQTNLNTLLRSYASTACGGLPCQVKTYSACQLQPDGTNYLAVGYATYGCRGSTC